MRLPAILAADAGAIVAVIFGLISFIGWIINQVNGQQKPPPVPRKRAPRDRSIQDEIDKFLTDKDAGPRDQNRRDEEGTRPEPRETRPQPPRKAPAPKPVQQKPRPKPNPKAGAQQVPSRPQPPRPVAAPAPPKAAAQPSVFGSHMQQHVADTMAPRIGQAVQKDLPHSIDQSVSQHLGKFSVATVRDGADQKMTSLALIVDMIRKPESVRAAIIVNEILGPPLSARGSRRR